MLFDKQKINGLCKAVPRKLLCSKGFAARLHTYSCKWSRFER